jgi:hypothetical protein
LGVVGAGEFIRFGVQKKSPEIAPENRRCLINQFPGRMIPPVLAHSGLLRPLTGEGEDDHGEVGESFAAALTKYM